MAEKFDLEGPEGRPEPNRIINLEDVISQRRYLVLDWEDQVVSIASRPNPEDQASKRRIDEAAAALQRAKDQALFYTALGVVAASFALCAYVVLRRGASSEEGKWAATLLTVIVTGLVGYVTGRQTK